MNLKKGQSVKVKKGVLCPDDPEFDLSGWQGRIIDVSEDENGEITIGIAWDSLTFKEMPERYIEKSKTDGLDWTVMYLPDSDVEQVKPRDSEKYTDEIRNELEGHFEWLEIGGEGKRIQAVINSAKSNDEWEMMEVWEKYLKQNLKFPFESVVDEYQSKSPFRQGDRLRVSGIETVDDLYGVIVSCKAGRRKYYFPLADLAAADEVSDNSRHIQDYRVWFANRE
ncbi:hypothetical protein JWG39_15575 [Desulforhopalus vacuolatus]|uniref:calcium-binding protein n=1 Tax=Desulforhopalus vacuolatus TaxID=40414 RepID=UPI0019649F62|nr:calcium-binding protein [Desulforhopalus vacuolatus]MBM9521240.1 hypothetical protein [Desulforhopalus vacuolatus]